MLERKLGTKDWSMRVNMSIFAMCVIDVFLIAKACGGYKEAPVEFFTALSEELIDNTFDMKNTRNSNIPIQP